MEKKIPSYRSYEFKYIVQELNDIKAMNKTKPFPEPSTRWERAVNNMFEHEGVRYSDKVIAKINKTIEAVLTADLYLDSLEKYLQDDTQVEVLDNID